MPNSTSTPKFYRKARKLLRDPRAFFRDSSAFQQNSTVERIVIWFDRSLARESSAIGSASADPADFSSRESPRRRAVAFHVGFHWRPAVREILSEYSIRFVRLHKNEPLAAEEASAIKREAAKHSNLVFLVWGYFEPPGIATSRSRADECLLVAPGAQGDDVVVHCMRTPRESSAAHVLLPEVSLRVPTSGWAYLGGQRVPPSITLVSAEFTAGLERELGFVPSMELLSAAWLKDQVGSRLRLDLTHAELARPEAEQDTPRSKREKQYCRRLHGLEPAT